MKEIDPFTLIKDELDKYSLATIREFVKMFPCKQKNYFIPVQRKGIIIKGRSVGASTLFGKSVIQLLTFDHVTCASAKDFWYRWKKFKVLKVFL
jgi:hypothetical protein